MDVFVGDLPVQPPAAIQWRSGSLVDSGAADAAAVCAAMMCFIFFKLHVKTQGHTARATSIWDGMASNSV